MRTSRPKPKSLRPLSVKHRWWFWIFIFIGIAVIATSWFFRIRDLMIDVMPLKSSIGEFFEQAIVEIQETQTESDEQIYETTEALKALKDGYDIEKQRQQTSIE